VSFLFCSVHDDDDRKEGRLISFGSVNVIPLAYSRKGAETSKDVEEKSTLILLTHIPRH
jgi:hypothetical protein